LWSTKKIFNLKSLSFSSSMSYSFLSLSLWFFIKLSSFYVFWNKTNWCSLIVSLAKYLIHIRYSYCLVHFQLFFYGSNMLIHKDQSGNFYCVYIVFFNMVFWWVRKYYKLIYRNNFFSNFYVKMSTEIAQLNRVMLVS